MTHPLQKYMSKTLPPYQPTTDVSVTVSSSFTQFPPPLVGVGDTSFPPESITEKPSLQLPSIKEALGEGARLGNTHLATRASAKSGMNPDVFNSLPTMSDSGSPDYSCSPSGPVGLPRSPNAIEEPKKRLPTASGRVKKRRYASAPSKEMFLISGIKEVQKRGNELWFEIEWKSSYVKLDCLSESALPLARELTTAAFGEDECNEFFNV